METVKILDSSHEELPGVEDAERSEGDGGNCGPSPARQLRMLLERGVL